jgi:hypothetical protein
MYPALAQSQKDPQSLENSDSPLFHPLSNEKVEIQRAEDLCKSSACIQLDSGTLPPLGASPGEQAVVGGLPWRGLGNKREAVSAGTLLPIWLVFLESLLGGGRVMGPRVGGRKGQLLPSISH